MAEESPESDYPHIRVNKKTYQNLRDLKFELRCDSYREVIDELIEFYREREGD